jgi:hypothetical protein
MRPNDVGDAPRRELAQKLRVALSRAVTEEGLVGASRLGPAGGREGHTIKGMDHVALACWGEGGTARLPQGVLPHKFPGCTKRAASAGVGQTRAFLGPAPSLFGPSPSLSGPHG